MSYNLGELNEIDFVKYLNNKKYCELNIMHQIFLNDLFKNIGNNDTIICKKNKYKTKTDIFISINGIQKRISIKMGYNNSVHVEPISSFIHFLIENNIDRKIIIEYLKYHYADGSTNGTGINRISSKEYKMKHQKEVDEINNSFNNVELVKKAINRFVIQGRNSKYEIDAIVYGTINDFLWIKKEDIYKILLKKMNIYSTGIHFSSLFCQPQDRCLNNNLKYDKKRYCVQIKWYSLFDDIINNMNDNFSLMVHPS